MRVSVVHRGLTELSRQRFHGHCLPAWNPFLPLFPDLEEADTQRLLKNMAGHPSQCAKVRRDARKDRHTFTKGAMKPSFTSVPAEAEGNCYSPQCNRSVQYRLRKIGFLQEEIIGNIKRIADYILQTFRPIVKPCCKVLFNEVIKSFYSIRIFYCNGIFGGIRGSRSSDI